jgi:hypothetical protein
MDRQRVHRAAVEKREVGGGVSARLREWNRGANELAHYFRTYDAVHSHQSLDYRTPEEVYFGELGAVTLMAA